MSKKQMIRRRGLCSLLAVAMCIGVLPPTAGAAVTAKNDWEIFDASDTYNLPSTQEQILQEMIQNPKFAEKWAAIANNVLPKTYYNDTNEHGYHEPYTALTAADYAKVQYTAKGLRDAVRSVVDQSAVLNGSGVLNSLPEEETPVYYVSTRAERERDDHHSYVSTGYGYYVQAFYDFEIQGIANRFETPSIEADDTTALLEQKGYQFNLGGSSDSYKVTAENRNDFENTVEKSYTYEKSTTTSTTVSKYLFTKLDRGDHGRRRIQRARSGRAFAHCQGRAELFLLLRHGKDLREQQGGVLRAVQLRIPSPYRCRHIRALTSMSM